MLAVAVACFVVGLIAQHVRADAQRLVEPLDFAVLSITLPALVIAKLPELELGDDLILPVALAWAAIGLAAAAVMVGARVHGWGRTTTGALLLVATLGNTTFLGLPMIESLLGDEALSRAIAFDQLGNFLGLAIYGAVIAAHWGTGESGWRPALERLLRFPPFIAVLVSFVVRRYPLPDGLVDVLAGVGTLVAPLAMLAVGLRFRLAAITHARTAAIWCLGIKMLLLPLAAALAAVVAGGLDDPSWAASTLQAGMPPMVTASVIAADAELDGELATTVVGIGLLVALVTIPLLSLLFP